MSGFILHSIYRGCGASLGHRHSFQTSTGKANRVNRVVCGDGYDWGSPVLCWECHEKARKLK